MPRIVKAGNLQLKNVFVRRAELRAAMARAPLHLCLSSAEDWPHPLNEVRRCACTCAACGACSRGWCTCVTLPHLRLGCP